MLLKMTMNLYVPLSYTTATLSQRSAICNGCGSSKAKFDFVPDTIYGLCITAACHIHDWMYHEGKTIEDKKEADRAFLNNLIRIIDNHGGLLKFLRRRRARKYYLAVKYFGGPAYWNGKN